MENLSSIDPLKSEVTEIKPTIFTKNRIIIAVISFILILTLIIGVYYQNTKKDESDKGKTTEFTSDQKPESTPTPTEKPIIEYKNEALGILLDMPRLYKTEETKKEVTNKNYNGDGDRLYKSTTYSVKIMKDTENYLTIKMYENEDYTDLFPGEKTTYLGGKIELSNGNVVQKRKIEPVMNEKSIKYAQILEKKVRPDEETTEFQNIFGVSFRGLQSYVVMNVKNLDEKNIDENPVVKEFDAIVKSMKTNKFKLPYGMQHFSTNFLDLEFNHPTIFTSKIASSEGFINSKTYDSVIKSQNQSALDYLSVNVFSSTQKPKSSGNIEVFVVDATDKKNCILKTGVIEHQKGKIYKVNYYKSLCNEDVKEGDKISISTNTLDSKPLFTSKNSHNISITVYSEEKAFSTEVYDEIVKSIKY